MNMDTDIKHFVKNSYFFDHFDQLKTRSLSSTTDLDKRQRSVLEYK